MGTCSGGERTVKRIQVRLGVGVKKTVGVDEKANEVKPQAPKSGAIGLVQPRNLRVRRVGRCRRNIDPPPQRQEGIGWILKRVTPPRKGHDAHQDCRTPTFEKEIVHHRTWNNATRLTRYEAT